MLISPLSGPVGTASSPAGGIAGDFDRFLRLLTTQLQHQDPLSPLDATQFTTQLVQFSQVEQSVNTNKRLADLVALQANAQMQSAFGYVGQTVDVLSQELPLAGGKADLFYAVDGAATEVRADILDSAGRLVRTLKGGTGTGVQRLAWDGKNDNGTPMPDGTYALRVTASDAAQKALPTQVGVSGRVTEIVNDGGQLMLSIGGMRAPMSEVVAVRLPPDAKS